MAAAVLARILAGDEPPGRRAASSGQRREGALLLTLGNGMVHVAETRIDSSVAAMIVGTVPC